MWSFLWFAAAKLSFALAKRMFAAGKLWFALTKRKLPLALSLQIRSDVQFLAIPSHIFGISTPTIRISRMAIFNIVVRIQK